MGLKALTHGCREPRLIAAAKLSLGLVWHASYTRPISSVRNEAYVLFFIPSRDVGLSL